DLDHLGAQVGEHLAAQRALLIGKVKQAESFEQFRRHRRSRPDIVSIHQSVSTESRHCNAISQTWERREQTAPPLKIGRGRRSCSNSSSFSLKPVRQEKPRRVAALLES